MQTTRPITRRGDSLIYRASAFRSGEEKNMAALLGKMPGLTVAPGGQVSYNGKPIERIMVHGNDLFGRGYAILSENLDARAIREVQVIEKYQSNQELKGIQRSDAVAINIELNEGMGDLSGNIGAGWGYKANYRVEGTLLYVLSKLQVHTTAGSNNMGRLYGAEASSLIARDGLDVLDSKEDGSLQSASYDGASGNYFPTGAAAPLSNRRARRNTSHQASVNGSYAPAKRLKLMCNTFFYQGNEQFDRSRTVGTEHGGNIYRYTTNTHRGTEKAELGLKLLLQWQPNRVSSLVYEGNGFLNRARDQSAHLYQRKTQREGVETSLGLTGQSLVYTLAFPSVGALRLGADWTFYESPDSYTLEGFSYLSDSPFRGKDRGSKQQGELRAVFLSKPWHGFSCTLDASGRWKEKSSVQTSFRRIPSSGVPLRNPADALFAFSGRRLGLKAQVSYFWRFFIFEVGAEGELRHRAFTIRPSEEYQYAYLSPMGSVKFQNRVHLALLSYGLSNTIANEFYYQEYPRLTAFNSLYYGGQDFAPTQKQTVAAAYRFGNPYTRKAARLFAMYSRDSAPISSEAIYFEDYTLQRGVRLPTEHTLITQGALDYYISRMRTSFTVSATGSEVRGHTAIDGQIYPSATRQLRGGAKLRTALSWPVNLALGVRGQFTSHAVENSAHERMDSSAYVDLYVTPYKGVLLTLTCDRQQKDWRDGGAHNGVLFFDISLGYKKPQRHWGVFFEVYNLLNHEEYRQSQDSPFTHQESHYAIPGCRWLAGFSWSFN